MGEIELGKYFIEWDDNKEEANYKKHGIRFRIAARIFLDKNKIEDYDELHSENEDRWKVVGKVRDVLVVIYTERGEKYRLISARFANKREEDEYYGQYPNL